MAQFPRFFVMHHLVTLAIRVTDSDFYLSAVDE